jgi:hypothetical protein
MFARYALAAALLVACAPPVASGGGTTPTGAQGGTVSPWTMRGDAACRTLPTEAPPCPASLDAPEGVAVWLNGEVIPLREALRVMVLPDLAAGELAACDLARFPLPRTCMIASTCEGADVVVPAAYVRGIAREYVAQGFRCW